MPQTHVRALLPAVVALALMAGPGSASAAAPPGNGSVAGPASGLARSPELSVTSRLSDRREVAAGTRAYSIGFEDGRFYANGWHTTGEMGGIWTPPVKLLDGVW
ncbi:MAG: hypothetical protein J2P32_17575, partial [Actinobacteria bacterium]|nr:hypothetical protein [Actinomycetota bacterium]